MLSIILAATITLNGVAHQLRGVECAIDKKNGGCDVVEIRTMAGVYLVDVDLLTYQQNIDASGIVIDRWLFRESFE